MVPSSHYLPALSSGTGLRLIQPRKPFWYILPVSCPTDRSEAAIGEFTGLPPRVHPVLPQRAILPPQPRQLGPLMAGQPRPVPGIGLCLSHPGPHRRLGQVKVLGHLPDRPVTSPAPLHDLRLELRRERPAAARPLPVHDLHDEHPFGGRTPDGGC